MASHEPHGMKDHESGTRRKTWQPMSLAYLGKAKDIVQGGGGKVTRATGDPGEPRKVPGQG
jgi:hypothetical protein